MKRKYKVLVRTDEQSRVVEIASSAYMPDTDGWVQIDEGEGDRYMHAQGNYLPGGLTDERGVYRYKLVDGALAARSQDEMDADYAVQPTQLSVTQRTAALEEAMDMLLTGVTEDG